MVTQDKQWQTVGSKDTKNTVFYGMSTDEKPIANTANGSVFIEMDTAKLYFYDAENTTWYEFGGE